MFRTIGDKTERADEPKETNANVMAEKISFMPSLSNRQDKSLDYLRAIAALLVVGFHASIIYPKIPAISNWPFFAVIRQGYTGVSLFLVLSGFLFMKLGLERGFPEKIKNFYLNRLLRVGPLFLVIYILATAINRNSFEPGDLIYLLVTNIGSPPTSDQFITGTAWTISLELFFYIIFPFLGKFAQKGGLKYLAKLFIIALFLKAALYISSEHFQLAMYSTLIGRIDQFLFGMAGAIMIHNKIIRIDKWKARLLSSGLALLLIPYSIWLEGHSPLGSNENTYFWLLIPSAEALLFTGIIIFSFEGCTRYVKAIDSPLTRIAASSYSLYLLHPAALKLVEWLSDRSNYLNLTLPIELVAIFGLTLSLFIAEISYQTIEKPFLKLKKPETNS